MALSGKLSDFYKWLGGLGYVAPPDPGNQANAPADPPVQTGGYQFIQETMYGPADLLNSTGDDQAIVNIPTVPPGYRDSDKYPVNEYGLSGLEGGGTTGDVPNQWGQQGSVLYFDPTTGLYIDLLNNTVSTQGG